MMTKADLERVAATIREVANAEALPRWRNLAAGDIVEKSGPDDVVTVADSAVEAALTARLMQLYPGTVVVGEEAVHADPTRIDLLRGDTPAWIIDPIDGTSAFAAGSPDFAVMVGLVSGGAPVGGWILVPVTGVLTAAVRGEGVWRSTGAGFDRLAIPQVPCDLAVLKGAVGRKRTDPSRQARVAAAAPRFASMQPAICAGIEYPRLAAGEIHFSLYNKSEPWDHLPGLAMAAEHGFHYAQHDGAPYRPGDNTGGLLVAPSLLHWQAIHEALLA